MLSLSLLNLLFSDFKDSFSDFNSFILSSLERFSSFNDLISLHNLLFSDFKLDIVSSLSIFFFFFKKKNFFLFLFFIIFFYFIIFFF